MNFEISKISPHEHHIIKNKQIWKINKFYRESRVADPSVPINQSITKAS